MLYDFIYSAHAHDSYTFIMISPFVPPKSSTRGTGKCNPCPDVRLHILKKSQIQAVSSTQYYGSEEAATVSFRKMGDLRGRFAN